MKRTTDRRRQAWKETRVNLGGATALLMDGPGNEWLLLLRGQRTPPSAKQRSKGGRS
jgi:hypothetical protein